MPSRLDGTRCQHAVIPGDGSRPLVRDLRGQLLHEAADDADKSAAEQIALGHQLSERQLNRPACFLEQVGIGPNTGCESPMLVFTA